MTVGEFFKEMFSENGKISSMRVNMFLCTVTGIVFLGAAGIMASTIMFQGGATLVGAGILGKAAQSIGTVTRKP